MDIDVQELKKRMAAGEDLAILDVREQYEYDDFNIGAKLIPLGELMNRSHEIDDWKSREVIVHCRSGMRSNMAKQMLLGAGFENVRNLTGGMLAWTEA